MKRLYKSKNDVKISGVCAGIAEYFDIDPTLVRIAAIFLLFFGVVPVLAAYAVGFFIIPDEDEEKKTIKVSSVQGVKSGKNRSR